MPRLRSATPKYRLHKATGHAVVTLSGRDFYLGPHSTAASKAEYDRLVSEWLANGRRLTPAPDEITVVELVAAYRPFAETHYRKSDGTPTGELDGMLSAAKPLLQLYGRLDVAEFGPLKLRAVIQQMIDGGTLSRSTINKQVRRIKRIFKWGVSQELIDVSVYQSLLTVSELQRGRTDAKEAPPVEPVAAQTVELTIAEAPVVVADMVRFQRFTGCRPGEVCILRPCDVDTTGAVWVYRPSSHKTLHRGRERAILIGPRAQQVLRPYLLRAADQYCFSPLESEGRRRDVSEQSALKLKLGDCYTVHSYRRAIHRACDLAFPPDEPLKGEALKQWRSQMRWSPNRLRHLTATEIRKQFGLEGSQVILGHASADVTQVYAERDLKKAEEIAKRVG